MRTVILVPWRGGNRLRERNWALTRPSLEVFRWPIILGDRPGPWSRAAACNQAALEAGDWEVAVIVDADTIPEEQPVREAVQRVAGTDFGLRPHDRLWHLSGSEMIRFLHLGARAFARRPPRHAFLGGGLMVVSREAWQTIGGYDEGFVGWGHEDSALGIALIAKARWGRIPGQAFHLWHPRDATDTPEREANRRRMEAMAREHRRAIRRTSAELGFDVGAVL